MKSIHCAVLLHMFIIPQDMMSLLISIVHLWQVQIWAVSVTLIIVTVND